MPGTVILIFMSYNLLMAGLCKFVGSIDEGDWPPQNWNRLAVMSRNTYDFYNTRFVIWLIIYIVYNFISAGMAGQY